MAASERRPRRSGRPRSAKLRRGRAPEALPSARALLLGAGTVLAAAWSGDPNASAVLRPGFRLPASPQGYAVSLPQQCLACRSGHSTTPARMVGAGEEARADWAKAGRGGAGESAHSIRKLAVKPIPAAVIISANVPKRLRSLTGGGFNHIRLIVSQMPTIIKNKKNPGHLQGYLTGAGSWNISIARGGFGSNISFLFRTASKPLRSG